MDDFTIVDANGTPINYGTRTRGTNLSPEQACAASSMPSYLGGKPSQFQSAPPVPSYTGEPLSVSFESRRAVRYGRIVLFVACTRIRVHNRS